MNQEKDDEVDPVQLIPPSLRLKLFKQVIQSNKWTAKEAASHLGVSESWIKKLNLRKNKYAPGDRLVYELISEATPEQLYELVQQIEKGFEKLKRMIEASAEYVIYDVKDIENITNIVVQKMGENTYHIKFYEGKDLHEIVVAGDVVVKIKNGKRSFMKFVDTKQLAKIFSRQQDEKELIKTLISV